MLDYALTTAEITTFLGVSFWRTAIDLPPHSYFVELRAFAEGMVRESIIECGPDMLLPKKQSLTVMLGPDRAAMLFSTGSSVFKPTKACLITGNPRWPIELPRHVGLGDFVLCVQAPQYFDEQQIENMPSSASGFLLRIRNA